MSDVRHVLGISGGKDSAALAIYLRDLYPELDIEFYSCDTGRELDETYQLIDNLEARLGTSINRLDPVDSNNLKGLKPFDHFLELYGGYLPSSSARWCTKKLKLEPFERYIGSEPTISYVGIRGDEDRDGYISKKQSVQSIFPFRKNIWSEDVNLLVLKNQDNATLLKVIDDYNIELNTEFLAELENPLSVSNPLKTKLNRLLDIDTVGYNKLVFHFLKQTDYPVGSLDTFPLVENTDNLVREDIFKILEESGVGVPAYYKPLEYEVEIDGKTKKGVYSRSRSGCFFCFFQQKIEWVWLYETHRELYLKAMEYEKDGYSWMDSETLEELAQPDRIKQIKLDHYKKSNKLNNKQSWKDQLMEAEGEGCASCFI